MDPLPIQREEWALLVLSSSTSGIDRMQLQKSLFLLSRRVPHIVGSTFYRFVPYKFGPFCADIYADVDRLALAGCVDDDGREAYTVTAEGQATAAALAIPARVRTYVAEVVRSVTSVSWQALLRAIYSQFPEMATRTNMPDLAIDQPEPPLAAEVAAEILAAAADLDAKFGEDWQREAEDFKRTHRDRSVLY